MADIFISYSSADRPTAQAVAQALEQQGFSVWWDRKIPTGEAFDEELEEQLDHARSVVVLWSSHSVKSKWVKDEASEGLTKKALFPLVLDDVRLPFGYRRIQTADFKQWTAGEPHLGFDQLVASLKRAFGGGEGMLEIAGDHPGLPSVRHNWFIDRWRRSIVFRIGLLALPALAMGAGAVVMMKVRLPTHVQLDLAVNKVQFVVGGTGLTPILDTLSFSSLSIEKFRSVSFSPRALRVADAQMLEEADAQPDPWRTLAAPATVTFTGHDESLQPTIRIEAVEEGADGHRAAGKLDLLLLQPGTSVTLERKGQRRGIVIKVDGQALSPAAIASGPIRIHTTHVGSKGLGVPGSGNSMVFEVQNRESSPEITIDSAPGGLILAIGLAGDSPLELLPKGGAAITGVRLIDISIEDRWESTLVDNGKLSYPDHPSVEPVSVSKSDLIGLGELSKFAITQINLDPKANGLQLRMNGKAKKVILKTGEFSRDARLTVLDIYRSSANAAFFVTLVLGVISATWSAFTAFREIRA